MSSKITVAINPLIERPDTEGTANEMSVPLRNRNQVGYTGAYEPNQNQWTLHRISV
jgi:hypothetical protein